MRLVLFHNPSDRPAQDVDEDSRWHREPGTGSWTLRNAPQTHHNAKLHSGFSSMGRVKDGHSANLPLVALYVRHNTRPPAVGSRAGLERRTTLGLVASQTRVVLQVLQRACSTKQLRKTHPKTPAPGTQDLQAGKRGVQCGCEGELVPFSLQGVVAAYFAAPTTPATAVSAAPRASTAFPLFVRFDAGNQYLFIIM